MSSGTPSSQELKLGERNLVTFVGQDLGEELADADFVVDDEDLGHG